MLEDYSKYLSLDNGKGILISKNDALILDRYSIDYRKYSSYKELIMIIEEVLEEDPSIEDLEDVLKNISEIYYYNEVNK